MYPNRKVFYTRNLPHWQPPQSTFFISYRTINSIPKATLLSLKKNYHKQKLLPQHQSPHAKESLRHQYLLQFQNAIDRYPNAPNWLVNPAIASLIKDSLFFNHNVFYQLWAFSIMPAYTQVVLSTLPNAPSLDVILQYHKRFTARHCNLLLNRSGQFWQHESYDRLLKTTTAFMQMITHIQQNPTRLLTPIPLNDLPFFWINPALTPKCALP